MIFYKKKFFKKYEGNPFIILNLWIQYEYKDVYFIKKIIKKIKLCISVNNQKIIISKVVNSKNNISKVVKAHPQKT